MNDKKMLTTKEVAQLAGVNLETVRRWDKKGLIKSYITDDGRKRYDVDSVNAYIGQPGTVRQDKYSLIYARVSTKNREDDLNRQVELLEMFCASHGWKYKILKDVDSGLNYNKKGLIELIKLIETNQIDRLIINYKDRYLRFQSEIIFEICKWHNIEVIFVS